MEGKEKKPRYLCVLKFLPLKSRITLIMDDILKFVLFSLSSFICFTLVAETFGHNEFKYICSDTKMRNLLLFTAIVGIIFLIASLYRVKYIIDVLILDKYAMITVTGNNEVNEKEFNCTLFLKLNDAIQIFELHGVIAGLLKKRDVLKTVEYPFVSDR